MPHKGFLQDDIPTNPNQTYKNMGWNGSGDWLGTRNIAPRLRVYRSFEEAQIFASSLGLRNSTEWSKFCKGRMLEKGTLPLDIPASPHATYAGRGWSGYGDWLGTGNIANYLRHYRPFKEAQAFARSLGLRSVNEWKNFCTGSLQGQCSLPLDIPVSPSQTYADEGWTTWGEWLGTGIVAPRLRMYRPFEDARSFVRGLGLKGAAEWRSYCKGNMPEKGSLPPDIPNAADHVYADSGWASMGDWLGTGTIAPRLRLYRPFEDARNFAHSLGLKSQSEWREFCKGNRPQKGALPSDISASPHKTYANKGWAGMADWLGTGRTRVSKSPKGD